MKRKTYFELGKLEKCHRKKIQIYYTQRGERTSEREEVVKEEEYFEKWKISRRVERSPIGHPRWRENKTWILKPSASNLCFKVKSRELFRSDSIILHLIHYLELSSFYCSPALMSVESLPAFAKRLRVWISHRAMCKGKSFYFHGIYSCFWENVHDFLVSDKFDAIFALIV